MKKGFTLIEVLAVIALLAALSLIVLPTITNQLNKSKGTINDSTMKLVSEATATFIDMNQSEYPMKEGNVYCIPIQTLVKYGNLKSPVTDVKTGKDIDPDHDKVVKSIFSSDIDIEYQVVHKTACTEVRI